MKCSHDVKCVDISEQVDVSVQAPLLVDRPDIVVATPARALAHLKANTLDLKSSLEIVIIDEADLVFSFGYEDDMKAVLKFLPKLYQAVLASATLSEDVLSLKHLVLRHPVILKLEEPPVAPVSQLSHYHILAQEDEKATILYTLLKLNLVQGKTIIFVNTVDKCYKLKLYLEQFKISTCVLNSELPAKARCHAVYQFNQGLYDIIIASDERALETPQISSTNNRKRKRDKESGVSRGIDFQFVSNVINFDFPLDIQCYIHRAGRTARGKNQGTALSFVSLREQDLMNEVNEFLMSNLHEEDFIIKPYQFNLDEVKGFEYRAKDAWRSVTKIAVREARLKEIKQEILNSQKLKNYFEDNPSDLESLRHDKALHTVRTQSHLAFVPDYIVPPALRKLAGITDDDLDGDVRAEPITDEEYTKQYDEYTKRVRAAPEEVGKRKYKARRQTAEKAYQKKQANPLLGMNFTGIKKKKT